MSMPPPPPAGSERAYWICQIAGWYGYAAAQVLVVALIQRMPGAELVPAELAAMLPRWPRAAIELFGLASAGIGVSHALRGIIRRRRWDALAPPQLALRIFIAGFLASPFLGAPQHFMATAALHQGIPGTPGWSAFLQQAIQWAPLFWIWLAIYFLALNARKRRRMELRQSELSRELQAAELRALKSQLNPHFLFNSLNSVRALISEDPARAQQAVTELARTLRYTLGSTEQLVTLEQELQMVGDYLALEGLRLGERLRVEREVSDAALTVRVPVMLLQTLVENAIKHGIAELPAGGALRLQARVQDGALLLEIENPRPAIAPSANAGVGIRNSVERLRLLFGEAAKLELDLSSPARAIARVRIPVDA